MRRVTASLVIGLLALGAVFAADEQELAKRSFLNGKLSLLIPTSFTEMSEDILHLKYPSERRPTMVLTNPRGSVNVAVNHTHDPLEPGQLREAHVEMTKMMRNLYPSATWNRNEIVSRNGHEFFIMDIRTPAIDTEIRNIMSGTSLDGRFLILTFNCTRELESEWGAVGRRIIESATLGK